MGDSCEAISLFRSKRSDHNMPRGVLRGEEPGEWVQWTGESSGLVVSLPQGVGPRCPQKPGGLGTGEGQASGLAEGMAVGITGWRLGCKK